MSKSKYEQRLESSRKGRIKKNLEPRAETWLVVSEGKCTEKNYFDGFKKYYKENKGLPLNIHTVGGEMNTMSLVQCTDDIVENCTQGIDSYNGEYAKIFVVFDKDDFPNDHFDNAIKQCESRGYIPLWSNQCFELWLVLHYQYLNSAINKDDYCKRLKDKLGKKYEKNNINIFSDIIGEDISKLKFACKNSKKLYNLFLKDTPSGSNPCTVVYKFFDCIKEYNSKNNN